MDSNPFPPTVDLRPTGLACRAAGARQAGRRERPVTWLGQLACDGGGRVIAYIVKLIAYTDDFWILTFYGDCNKLITLL